MNPSISLFALDSTPDNFPKLTWKSIIGACVKTARVNYELRRSVNWKMCNLEAAFKEIFFLTPQPSSEQTSKGEIAISFNSKLSLFLLALKTFFHHIAFHKSLHSLNFNSTWIQLKKIFRCSFFSHWNGKQAIMTFRWFKNKGGEFLFIW